MISVDTETTGLDLYHGCRPFFVSICDSDGQITYWEWLVDPRTRMPEIPEEDLDKIRKILSSPRAREIVLHNAKFDIRVLESVGIQWPRWSGTHDTAMMAHVVRSNQMKDLSTLSEEWLGEVILGLEEELEACVKEVRKKVQLAKARVSRMRGGVTKVKRKTKSLFDDEEGKDKDLGEMMELAEWRIAEKGDSMLPSGTEEVWRSDYWLPMAYAEFKGLPETHRYRRCLREYAVKDPETTMALAIVLGREMDRLGLRELYDRRRRVLEFAHDMERTGIAMNLSRVDEMTERYGKESEELARRCVEIAKPFPLVLPAGASPNNSIREFIYDHLGLEKLNFNQKSRTAAPSLDKNVLTHYIETLPEGSRGHDFVTTLVAKRKRDTYLGYIKSYRRFCVQAEGCSEEWVLVHPSLNPVGTNTLRWSSSNPNEQSISENEVEEGGGTLRFLFGPLPGFEWWGFDAKNIELRLPAFDSQEPDLMDLFLRPKDPPYYGSEHLLNFHTVFPEVWEAVEKEVGFEKVGPTCKERYDRTFYKRTKLGGFAVGYGAVDRPDGQGTADRAFGRPGSHSRLKSRFRKKEQLNQRCIDQARRVGYVETMTDYSLESPRGYRIYCSRGWRGDVKPTLPLNYRTQSTAMNWTDKGMVKVGDFFKRLGKGERFAGRVWPGRYRIAIQQHDEIICEMPKKLGGKRYNMPIAEEVARLMETSGEDLRVPTPVGIKYHPENWSDHEVIR